MSEPLDVTAIQERLGRFAAERDWDQFHNPKNLAMALMVEAGELAEIFQWLTLEEAANASNDDDVRARIADEVAEVAIYLLRLADIIGVDLTPAIVDKIRRNELRFPSSPRESAVTLANVAELRSPSSDKRMKDVKADILKQIAASTGGPAVRLGRGESYRSSRGQQFHLRSNSRTDRGHGQTSYWFGLQEECWVEGHYFVLACDQDAWFVIPVSAWQQYRILVPVSGESRLEPTIWQVGGSFELRVGGVHESVDVWRERSDLL